MITSYQDYINSLIYGNISEDRTQFEKEKIVGRKGDWMATFNGSMFWPLDPRPEEVYIEDIAHSLALICRYNGHIKKFYSVAQHSVIISKICNPKYALFGLLHDASEAYVGDLISPIKRLLPNYKALEENILKAICKKFGIKLTKGLKRNVKKFDNIMLATEVRDLLNYKYLNWKMEEKPLKERINVCWSPNKSEKEFLKRFKELYGGK